MYVLVSKLATWIHAFYFRHTSSTFRILQVWYRNYTFFKVLTNFDKPSEYFNVDASQQDLAP